MEEKNRQSRHRTYHGGRSLMGLVVGIDGGGTKTLLCLADASGNIVHHSRGAGSSAMDNPGWLTNLRALLAGVAGAEFAVLAMGSYREVAEIDVVVDAGVKELLPNTPHEIENDVFMAREAAFPGKPGIALIAGTGSMAVAGDGQGKLVRTGGWGHIIGDEGSAYWIGREALGLATQAIDGRLTAKPFSDGILAALGEDASVGGVLGWLGRIGHQRSEIAALAQAVSALADDGDPTAHGLLEAAIDHLSRHIDAARQLAELAADAPWCAFGGVTRNPAIMDGLAGRQGRKMSTPALPPVGGALHRAALRAGWDIDDSWVARVAAGLNSFETGAAAPEKAATR
jgi:glucosamine kinase